MKYIKLAVLLIAFSCNQVEKKQKPSTQNSSIIVDSGNNNVIVNQVDTINIGGQNSTVIIKNGKGNNVEVNQSNVINIKKADVVNIGN